MQLELKLHQTQWKNQMDEERTNLIENSNMVTTNQDVVIVLVAIPASKGVRP